MSIRASKLVRELEDENDRLLVENRHLKIIIYRLVSKHGADIDLSPMDTTKSDTIANSRISLEPQTNIVQILS